MDITISIARTRACKKISPRYVSRASLVSPDITSHPDISQDPEACDRIAPETDHLTRFANTRDRLFEVGNSAAGQGGQVIGAALGSSRGHQELTSKRTKSA
jgi:hypothetical protein